MITRRELIRRGGAVAGLAAIGGFGLLLDGCGSAASSSAGGVSGGSGPSGTKAFTVVLGNPTMAVSFAFLSVAQELGYFKAEGLDPSFVPSKGTEAAAEQIGAGKAPIGFPAADPVIQGYQPGKGLHLKWFYTVYQGFIYDITVPEDSPIKTVADLKGKTVGVSSLASEGNAAIKAAIHYAGLKPNDVTIVATGVGAQAATALRSKKVDALALWDAADAVIVSAGIKLRTLDTPQLRKLFSNGMVCLPKLLGTADGKKQLTGFSRALAKGTIWMLANPTAAVQIHYKLYPQSKPSGKSEADAMAAGMLQLKARDPNIKLPPGITKWGWSDPSRWQAYEQFMLSAGLLKSKVDVTQCYTNELLDDANNFDASAIQKAAQAYTFKG